MGNVALKGKRLVRGGRTYTQEKQRWVSLPSSISLPPQIMYLKTQLTSPAAAVPSIPRSISPGPPTQKRVQALLGLSGYDLPYQKSPSPLVAEDDAPGDPKASESLRTAKNPSKASEELLPRMVEYQTALLHQFGEVALWNHGTKGNSSEISSQEKGSCGGWESNWVSLHANSWA